MSKNNKDKNTDKTSLPQVSDNSSGDRKDEKGAKKNQPESLNATSTETTTNDTEENITTCPLAKSKINNVDTKSVQVDICNIFNFLI